MLIRPTEAPILVVIVFLVDVFVVVIFVVVVLVGDLFLIYQAKVNYLVDGPFKAIVTLI